MQWADLKVGGADAMREAVAGRAAGVIAYTSGSTGEPRGVRLGRDAVLASVDATRTRLGRWGGWLLALPTDRVAGAMVVARAAATEAALVAPAAGPFSAASFAEATATLRSKSDGPLVTALVPTQVRRVLAEQRGVDALAEYAAVLVGGDAAPPDLPTNTVRTYGLTETCGGCVYDQLALPGTRIEIDHDADGRILLSGPTLADGYVDGDDAAFETRDGERWLRTGDLGRLDDDRLSVIGRVSEVIITGGHKVHPALVERALEALPMVHEAAVVGVADPEWGQAVVALVDSTEDAATVREALRGAVPDFAVPKRVVAVGSLPHLATGKIDRVAVRERAAQEVM